MKTIGKRLLSLLLVLAAVFQLVPGTVFAVGEDGADLSVEELLLTDAGSFAAPVEVAPEILFEDISLREENIKHFRMTDGSYTAVVFDTPVHYLDGDGVWQEYDNTLHTVSRNGEATAYRVENGDSVRLFAADAEDGALLSVQKGDYGLSLSPVPAAEGALLSEEIGPGGSAAEVLTTVAPAEEVIADSFYAQAQPEKLYSALEYGAILNGATLRYENYANSIKESIVIPAVREDYVYSFRMQTVGLTPVLLGDGSISLNTGSGSTVYTIPAPYMMDANGEVSYEAFYTLEESADGWLLTVTAEAEWMNAEGRAFPVLLDPTVTETAASDADISATFVGSGAPDSVSGVETGLYVGNNGNGYKNTRTYVHINALPELPDGCELTGAGFSLWQYSFSSSDELEIGVYALTQTDELDGTDTADVWKNWANTLTWNKAEGGSAVYDPTIIDRQTTSSAQSGSYLDFNITTLAFKWYDGEYLADSNNRNKRYYSNRGFLLRAVDESAMSRATFYGPKKTTNRPRVTISYRNTRGIEADYTYQTAAIGRAGTAYIGDFAMQTVLAVPLTSVPSDVMPLTVSLVYNSSMTGRYFSSSYYSIYAKNFNTMKIGIGWKLSLQETVAPLTVGGMTYLVYTDSDGTEHYYVQNDGVYVEEGENTRLTITVSGSDYILADEYGGRKLFTKGYLTETVDAYGNALYYCYDGVEYSAGSTAWKPTADGPHKITSVYRVNKGCAPDKILVLGYNGDFLSTILPKCDYSSEESKAACRISLTYEDRADLTYLTTITYADGATAHYSYLHDSDSYWDRNRLIKAYDAEANYGIEFGYAYSSKVREVFEYVLDENGQVCYGVRMHGSKLSHLVALWRDYGKDQKENKNDDYLTYKILNSTGRTVCAYTTDADTQHILGSSAAEYISSTSRKQNNLLSASAYTAQPGINLLRNSGAETDSSGWSAAAVSSGAHYSGAKSFVVENSAFYQTVDLTGGQTYTFSGYIRMDSDVSGGGIRLAFCDSTGNELAASPTLTTATAGINDGWQRLSVSYTPQGNISVRVCVLSSGLSADAYADCLQLEAEDAASTYNLAEDGSFEQMSEVAAPTSVSFVWYGAGSAVLSGGGCFGSNAVQVTGGSGPQRVGQKIQLNAPAGSTFLLSGWGKANALPDSVAEISAEDQAYFGLIARLYYEGGESEAFYYSFEPYNSNWQLAEGILVPSDKDKAITHAIIVAAYDNNINTAYFDNVSLRMEPAQTYDYDANGNLILAAQTDSGTQHAAYAANGVDLLSYTAANGTKYSYEYNAAHDVTSASVAGITATTTYNDAGNVTGSSLTGADTTLYTQSSATVTADRNHTASVTDANGNTTAYSYDAHSGLLTQVRNAKNQVTSYTYNTGNRRTESVRQDALVQINYGYENGDLTSLTRGEYAADAADHIDATTAQTYGFAYNLWGQLTTTSVGGQTLSNNTYYDFAGATEGAGGNLKSTTYGNGQSVSYTYDELDRLVKTSYTGGRYVSYIYNSQGQLAELSYGEGATVTATCVFEYDGLGRLIRSAAYDGNRALVQRTEHSYDAYSRLSGQSWVLGSTRYSENYAYSDGEDGDGSLSQMTTATGATIDYTYDDLKRLRRATVTDGGATLFTTAYAFRKLSANQVSGQIEFRNVRLGDSENILEGKKYEYDALGNIVRIYRSTDPFTLLAAYDYDAQNQLVGETWYDEDGNVTLCYEYSYDTAGNLLAVKKDGVTVQTYTYGDSNWRDLLTAVNGQTITYDGSGNPLSYGDWNFTWQNGRQLATATTGTSTTDTALGYTYDADGIRTSKTYTVSSYEDIPEYTVTFIADGRTVKVMTAYEGYVLQDRDYPAVPAKLGYSGSWNKYTAAIHSNITIQAVYTAVPTHTVTFTADGVTVKTMTVNDGYILKTTDYPTVPFKMGYEGRWNYYTAAIYSDITVTATYTKPGGVIPVPTLPPSPPGIIAGDDEEPTEPDAEPIEADAEPVEPDAEPIEVSAGGTPAEVAAASDREGQRLVSTQTVQHDYLTLNGKVVRETITTDGTVTAILDFVYDESGRPFALNYSTNGGRSFDTYYYVLNLQGDVVKLVWYIPGFEYEAVAEYTYDAWGNVLSSSGEMAEINPLRYRGYYYDTETGFYYLQSRYYDPTNRRFINADCYTSTGIGFVGTNMFAYCNNSPVICSDPTGQWTFTLTFLSASVTAFFFGAEISIGISVDDDWNVGLQWSYALPPYIDEETFIAGAPAAGASSPVQWTEVDTIHDLEGPGFNAGFSAGYLWYSWGGDFISTGDEFLLKDGDINGLQTGSGVGVGMDIHVAVSKTETIWEVNLKDRLFGKSDERE